jgi:hypothetical protein
VTIRRREDLDDERALDTLEAVRSAVADDDPLAVLARRGGR